MFFARHKVEMPDPSRALPGRDTPMPVPDRHFVLGTPLRGDFEGYGRAMFGMGCFWGAEKRFWEAAGVYTTAVGYAAGTTPNPVYEEVCSGLTGHNEVVWLAYDPAKIAYPALLQIFWESHDPTQGMRQGNDVGTQYRSGIYTYGEEQQAQAALSRERYEARLSEADYGPISTEILPAPTFYYAEGYHQQYLAKNPAGYCGLGGTGVGCPDGLLKEST